MVEGLGRHDLAGGVGEIGGRIDDHRRIAEADAECRLAGLVGLAHVDLAAGDDHQVGHLHQPGGGLARHRIRQNLHKVRRQPDLGQLRTHAVDGGLAGRPRRRRRGDDDGVAALQRHHGLVDGRRGRVGRGRDGADHAHGLGILDDALLGDLLDDAGGLGPEQVAQRAESLALVLDDLALQLADACDLDGDLGEPARVLGLVDRPGERGHCLVDARLPVRLYLCSIAGHCGARLDEHVGNVIVYRRLLRARFARGQLGVLHEEIFL